MFDKIQMILMMKTTVSSNRMSWWNSFFVSLNRIIKSKHKCFIYAERDVLQFNFKESLDLDSKNTWTTLLVSD